jgi:hypothetical protein
MDLSKLAHGHRHFPQAQSILPSVFNHFHVTPEIYRLMHGHFSLDAQRRSVKGPAISEQSKRTIRGSCMTYYLLCATKETNNTTET